jgi:eukaryotic-like serine/threonine-protein kinase
MNAIGSGVIVGGRYRLDAVLARGGMGSVWTAHHLSLDTRLAIKFIGPEIATIASVRRRFEREAKAAALLQSPHVVRIHDYGIDSDVPYLVMELLEGEDLGARLARRGRLSLPETVAIVSQVARALERAAEKQIVHRDLKPRNVFIAQAGDDEIVKVLDFGVAKASRISISDDTLAGGVVGSPRYMSPEQACGSLCVDSRSDLWSLAVIAYRALTGCMPFQAEEVSDVLRKICSESAPPPSQIIRAFGPEIDAFFQRALARAPEQRFQTARELSAALAEAAGLVPRSSRRLPEGPFSQAPRSRPWAPSDPSESARSGVLALGATREGADPDATVDPRSVEPTSLDEAAAAPAGAPRPPIPAALIPAGVTLSEPEIVVRGRARVLQEGRSTAHLKATPLPPAGDTGAEVDATRPSLPEASLFAPEAPEIVVYSQQDGTRTPSATIADAGTAPARFESRRRRALLSAGLVAVPFAAAVALIFGGSPSDAPIDPPGRVAASAAPPVTAPPAPPRSSASIAPPLGSVVDGKPPPQASAAVLPRHPVNRARATPRPRPDDLKYPF